MQLAYLFYRLFHRSNTLHLFYNTNQDALQVGSLVGFIATSNAVSRFAEYRSDNA